MFSFPSIFANFNNNPPDPQHGSYTLFTSFLSIITILASNSPTSCGVKNSPPDLPALDAYIVIKYSYASPKASIVLSE